MESTVKAGRLASLEAGKLGGSKAKKPGESLKA